MPIVHEISTLDELESLRLAWTVLHSRTPGRSFFHSLDWLSTYWRRFGAEQRLRVLAVESGGEWIGILPLVVRREKTRLGSVRVLTYPLNDWGSHYGPIGGQPAATLLAALVHLKQTRRDWDLLDLRWIDGETDRGRTRRALELAGFPAHPGVWDSSCVLDLPDSWEAYFATLTSKFRNNIRRAEKKLAELGEVELERYRPVGAAAGDDDPRWDQFDECVELSRRSWQGASHDGTTLCHPEVAEFFRDTHAAAAGQGALDLAVLRLSGRAIAFGYNYCTDGSLYGLRAGYDPEFAPCGAATVLMARMIRDSISRGDRRFDLGVATKEIKMRWNPRVTQLGRLTHYPAASPRAQLLKWKHRWDNPPQAQRTGAPAVGCR
jgi:CelD/BcsL family acetyltransferase involved in cellulose biosynthesis